MTRGQLPQKAGSPDLNGGGAAAAELPPSHKAPMVETTNITFRIKLSITEAV